MHYRPITRRPAKGFTQGDVTQGADIPRDVFTSGTLFASHKLPLRTYLSKTVIFINKVKDKSAFALGFNHASDNAG
jgi:hypothetical protein